MMNRNQVKDWRLKHRLTQKELARRLNVGLVTFAKFERGESEGMNYKAMMRLESLMTQSTPSTSPGEPRVSGHPDHLLAVDKEAMERIRVYQSSEAYAGAQRAFEHTQREAVLLAAHVDDILIALRAGKRKFEGKEEFDYDDIMYFEGASYEIEDIAVVIRGWYRWACLKCGVHYPLTPLAPGICPDCRKSTRVCCPKCGRIVGSFEHATQCADCGTELKVPKDKTAPEPTPTAISEPPAQANSLADRAAESPSPYPEDETTPEPKPDAGEPAKKEQGKSAVKSKPASRTKKAPKDTTRPRQRRRPPKPKTADDEGES